MSQVNKLGVYLGKTGCTKKKAVFGKCLVDQIRQLNAIEARDGEKAMSCWVRFTLSCDHLLLIGSSEKEENSYLMKHFAMCPAREFWESSDDASSPPDGASPSKHLTGSIAVGVSVLVESSDSKILVTRRAQHMRTFPGVWVPPGGHVEVGESFACAGLREVKEETGIDEMYYDEQPQVLGLWESVYPPLLQYGDPKRQHALLYMVMKLNLPAEQVKIQLQQSECDAGVWLPRNIVEAIVYGTEDGGKDPSIPESVPGVVVSENGESCLGSIDTSYLRRRMPRKNESGGEESRISTGTRFAMQLWLERKSTVSRL